MRIAPNPPLIGGLWCSWPTEASTWSWNGKLKSGKAMAGRDDMILINFFHASRASFGSGPLSFCPLHGWLGLVTAPRGAATSA